MSPRALAVVAALTAVAVLLAVVGQRRSAPSGTPAGELALPALAEALDEAARVTVVGDGGTAVTTIERGDTAWTVAERGGYRADLAQLREALVALSEARVVELKTSDPALHDRIGVEDVELDSARSTLVRIETETGAEHALILGDADRAGERYARRPAEAQSLLIDRDPDVPHDPAEWVEPRIVDVDGARVESVTIRHADGETLEIAKADASERNFSVAGVPEGRELMSPGVANATGSALRSLSLEDVARFDAETAGEPVATLAYSTFDGLGIGVAAHTIDGERWIVLDASAAESAAPEVVAEAEAIAARVGGWRYRIAPYQYDQMVRRLDDLLAPAE